MPEAPKPIPADCLELDLGTEIPIKLSGLTFTVDKAGKFQFSFSADRFQYHETAPGTNISADKLGIVLSKLGDIDLIIPKLLFKISLSNELMMKIGFQVNFKPDSIVKQKSAS